MRVGAPGWKIISQRRSLSGKFHKSCVPLTCQFESTVTYKKNNFLRARVIATYRRRRSSYNLNNQRAKYIFLEVGSGQRVNEKFRKMQSDTSSDVPPSDAVPLDSCNRGISLSLACSAKLGFKLGQGIFCFIDSNILLRNVFDIMLRPYLSTARPKEKTEMIYTLIMKTTSHSKPLDCITTNKRHKPIFPVLPEVTNSITNGFQTVDCSTG